MTLPAGTNLNLSPYCDEVLGYLYFRKSNGFIDTDLVDQDLSIPYEHCDIALKKLETDGFIEVLQNADSKLAKITPKGEVHYRTSSYRTESKKIFKNNRIEKVRVFKDILEILLFVFTIFLGVYSFTLNKDIKKLETEIELLKRETKSTEELKSEVEKLKSKIEENTSSKNIKKENK